MTNQLRMASGPQDFAQIYVDMDRGPQQTQGCCNFAIDMDRGCGKFMFICVPLTLVGAFFGASLYGAWVGAKYVDGNIAVCTDAARWILIQSIFALVQLVLCTPIKTALTTNDPLGEAGATKLFMNFNALVHIFAIGWFFYGSVLFFNADLPRYCKKEMWNWGYVYFIVAFSFLGLLCCWGVLMVIYQDTRKDALGEDPGPATFYSDNTAARIIWETRRVSRKIRDLKAQGKLEEADALSRRFEALTMKDFQHSVFLS